VPVRRAGTGEVAEVDEERGRRPQLRHLADELSEDGVRARVRPCPAVAGDHEAERIPDRRRPDPLHHRAVAAGRVVQAAHARPRRV
jgi:hypothetical protein